MRLMGIVNATPDSFSDVQRPKASAELIERGLRLVADGAQIVDVGGESGRTDTSLISEEEEAARIVPVIEELAGRARVSADTWRPGPAKAALDAGASMVNDVSGLTDPALLDLCASHDAALVITHTRVPPKVKDYADFGEGVMADVIDFLGERAERAAAAGVREIVLDPGFDLGKTTQDSVEILRRLHELDSLDRPLLLAISRKDFVGAITGSAPSERDAGTLGAIEPALDLDAEVILRLHDVRAARDFISVREALRSEGAIAELARELRRA